MNQLLMPLRRLLWQVLLLLGLYFLSRCIFTLINLHHFQGLTVLHFLRLAFFGLRYDVSAICDVNGLYIILFFLPLPYWRWPRWNRLLLLLFIVTNCVAFLFELGDWAYFSYNFKRATADVLRIVTTKGDFWSVLPDYLLSFWYVPLAMGLFIFLFIRLNGRIRKATPLNRAPEFSHRWLVFSLQTLLWVIICGLTAIGVRGGLQYIPIGLRNAVQVTDSRYVPIVLNTPFSIVTTLTTPSLEEVNYMSDAEASRLMPFRHQYGGKRMTKKNVVVLIIESGSKEFTVLGGRRSYTPFLDSLMGHSLVCTQAFANGQTSAEGIPAIIAGIPTMMDEAFTTSNYGTDRITALPGILKSEGYQSAFFHGGTNGTMSFDIFSSAAGFDQYFGRNEYANEADYDGAWGIWDEPFLQYSVRGMTKMRQPFFSSIFTLSSHPPYNLPPEYRNTLPAGSLPVQQCIAYTDQAIRKFFAAAARQPWYDSTLFVITADHCSPKTTGGYYAQGLGQYAIPIIFFAPGDSSLKGFVDHPVQQLDILPSVFQYLGYGKPFFAFGSSLFAANEKHNVITYNSEFYQWLQDGYLLQASGMKPVGLYAYPADSNSIRNLLKTAIPAKDSLLSSLKAFVQRYNSVLIHNNLQ